MSKSKVTVTIVRTYNPDPEAQVRAVAALVRELMRLESMQPENPAAPEADTEGHTA